MQRNEWSTEPDWRKRKESAHLHTPLKHALETIQESTRLREIRDNGERITLQEAIACESLVDLKTKVVIKI
jgi:hypothetical protein